MINNIKFEKLVCYIILTYIIISQTNLSTLLPESHIIFLNYNKHAQQILVILTVLLLTEFSMRYTTLVLIILLLFSTNTNTKPNRLLEEEKKHTHSKNPDEIIDELYDYYHNNNYENYNRTKKKATQKGKKFLDTFYDVRQNENEYVNESKENIVNEMKKLFNEKNPENDNRYELLKDFYNN